MSTHAIEHNSASPCLEHLVERYHAAWAAHEEACGRASDVEEVLFARRPNRPSIVRSHTMNIDGREYPLEVALWEENIERLDAEDPELAAKVRAVVEAYNAANAALEHDIGFHAVEKARDAACDKLGEAYDEIVICSPATIEELATKMEVVSQFHDACPREDFEQLVADARRLAADAGDRRVVA